MASDKVGDRLVRTNNCDNQMQYIGGKGTIASTGIGGGESRFWRDQSSEMERDQYGGPGGSAGR